MPRLLGGAPGEEKFEMRPASSDDFSLSKMSAPVKNLFYEIIHESKIPSRIFRFFSLLFSGRTA
jgi:hypothetical protein